MGVHLMGVCLMSKYLTGVYLTGVHLMGVHLMGIHLMGVYLMSVHLNRNENINHSTVTCRSNTQAVGRISASLASPSPASY